MNAHTKIAIMPLVRFQPFAAIGVDNVMTNADDPSTDIDGAIDSICNLSEYANFGDAWRIFRTELCPDTNMPIHLTDVTDEAREVLAERLRGRAA